MTAVAVVCPVGELEQLCSALSAADYDAMRLDLRESFGAAPAPPDVLELALTLQRDLAHHHGMWHRIAIPDLLIAETALHHDLGVLHVAGTSIGSPRCARGRCVDSTEGEGVRVPRG